jgi:hypothetical protein
VPREKQCFIGRGTDYRAFGLSQARTSSQAIPHPRNKQFIGKRTTYLDMSPGKDKFPASTAPDYVLHLKILMGQNRSLMLPIPQQPILCACS